MSDSKFWNVETADVLKVIETTCRMAREYDLPQIEVEYQGKQAKVSVVVKRCRTEAN